MTAKVSLDQSARIQQDLAELIHRTKELGKQAHSLETLTLPQVVLLGHQLEKEKKHPRRFIPLYDLAKNDEFLSSFNRKLLQLLSDIRLFEETLKQYKSAVHHDHVNSEVAHG